MQSIFDYVIVLRTVIVDIMQGILFCVWHFCCFSKLT